MHFKINDQSVYQILRGVEREVLASVASDLRFAYYTFGNNARDMAEMYGVEVRQHFHHQQVLIDRKCHGGNVLTFADDMANLQNTAKMLKVVDAGNSAFREYTVQEVWNKVHDVEFSKTDGLAMAQEAKFTNKFIREVTDEQRKQSEEQRIATLNGRTDEAKKQTKQRQREAHARRPDEAKKQTKQKQREGHARRPDEAKILQKQRQREGHARRPDEAKILQKQRQKEAHARRPDEAWALKKERHIARSAKRKENFDFVDLSSITVAFGKDIYSSPYVAATIVADFAGGDKKKRRARR